MGENKVMLFLYLLMRDEIPVGSVAKILTKIQDLTTEEKIIYTNKFLEDMSKDYAERLLDN